MSDRKKVDYERIEPGWRAGILSTLQLAADYEAATGQKVSHTAINKHFKKLDIPRDLSGKIQAKADALVSASLVSAEVSTETKVSEKAIIDANANAISVVRLSHRADIQRSRRVVMRLLDELELQTGQDNVDLLEQLGVLLRNEDDKGVDKLNDLYHKVISLPGRAKTMKDLGESLRVLVVLERQAFGLGDGTGKEGDDPADKSTKMMTDTERALRLSRLINDNPDALGGLLTALSKA